MKSRLCLCNAGARRLGFALVAVITCGAPGASAQLPPRYRVHPGDHLIYERRMERNAGDHDSSAVAVEHIEQWCLEDQGGSSLIVSVLRRTVGRLRTPPTGAFFLVDERGVKTLPDDCRARVGDLDGVLELWPECRSAINEPGPWLTAPDLYGRRLECVPLDPEAAAPSTQRVRFTLVDTSGAAEVLGLSVSGDYVFDRNAGLVTRLEKTLRSDSAGETRTTAELVGRRRMSAAWIKQQLADLEAYRRALRSEDRLVASLELEPSAAEATLQRLDTLWRALADDLAAAHHGRNRASPTRAPPAPGDEPGAAPFLDLAKGRRELLRALRPALLERARLAGTWNGRPAPHWSLQRLDNTVLTSESVRDRISLECFWRSDDLASLRMLLTLRRLREHLQDDALRIVCINMDDDLQRGRAAATRCAPELRHVFSGPPVGGERPAELPVIRIVDKNSRILRVLVGWRVSLLEIVTPLIS
jgi:hypothetical protein